MRLFSDNMYFSFAISVDFWSVCKVVSELFHVAVPLTLSEILLPIKSPVVSTVFWYYCLYFYLHFKQKTKIHKI